MSGDVEAIEPEYVIVQPGLDGVAWLGEVIDGELAPIGKVGDLLDAAYRNDVREAAAEQRGRETALREAADEFHERAQAHTLATVPSRAYRDANMQAAQWLRERA